MFYAFLYNNNGGPGNKWPEALNSYPSPFDDLRTMIHVSLGIRYISQLRRTRPELMNRVETGVARAMRKSGGKVTQESGFMFAVFDENVIAFWMDLVIALEAASDAISQALPDLFGVVCLVSAEPLPAKGMAARLRMLPTPDNGSGIWCETPLSSHLDDYVEFGATDGDGFLSIQEFIFRKKRLGLGGTYMYRKNPAQALSAIIPRKPEEPAVVVALLGAPLMGKKSTLRGVLTERGETFPAFIVSFVPGLVGLAPLAEAVSPELMQAVLAESGVDGEELRRGYGVVSSLVVDRFTEKPGEPRTRLFISYLDGFLSCWARACRAHGSHPVLIVEDVQNAGMPAIDILSMLYAKHDSKPDTFSLLMTGSDPGLFGKIHKGRIQFLRFEGLSREESGLFVSSAGEARGATGQPSIERIQQIASFKGALPAAYRTAIGWQQNLDGVPEKLHPLLSADCLEIAFGLYIAYGVLESGAVFEAFRGGGKPIDALPLILERLVELGVISSVDDPGPLIPDFCPFAERILGSRSERVRSLVRERLLESVSAKRVSNSYGFLETLVSLGGEGQDDLVLDVVVGEIVRGTGTSLLPKLDDGGFGRTVGASRFAALSRILRTGIALVSCDAESAGSVFREPLPTHIPSSRYRAYMLLDDASYSFWMNDLTSASSAAREASMLVQGSPRDHGSARAYRILGEIELARERISEAVDYFGFAAESAERSHDSFEALLSDVNSAATQFLLGNYSKAERHAAAAGKRASESYLEHWERWAKFMVARVRFETGSYQDAGKLFDKLRLEAAPDGRADYHGILDAWTNRVRVYISGPAASLIPETAGSADTGDGLLFKAESALLCAKYENARAYANDYLRLPVAVHSHNPECVSWKSGFSMVEDKVIGTTGEEPVGRKLARVIRGLATAELGYPREALVDLYRMAKEERISPCDPYDALYFRSLFLILGHAGTPEVDRGTVLSIAFKRLQKRASHIDDPETKRSYINQNRWNGALYTEAKAGNLI